MRRRSFLKLLSAAVAARRYSSLSATTATAASRDVGDSGLRADRSSPRDFLKFAKELGREKRIVVGVFHDRKYEGRETPASLRAEDFLKTWGAKSNVRVVLLDRQDIRSYSILFKGRMDLLVYPYGASYPMDAFPFYTGDVLSHFLKRGGAVLTTGGIPFARPLGEDLKSPPQGDLTPGVAGPDARITATAQKGLPTSSTYQKYVAPLGFKYYEHPFLPSMTKVNLDYLPSLPGTIEVAPCPIGLVANISSHAPTPKPWHGNVFPERYPVRQIIPLLYGVDDYGQVLATNALLVQDYLSGSRSIHFTHQKEPHPLSPSSEHFHAIMDDLFTLLTNKLMVKNVEPGFACYRYGETVQAYAEVANFSNQTVRAECLIEISDGKRNVHEESRIVEIPAKKSVIVQYRWSPSQFGTDEYEIYYKLHRKNKLVSSAENGFVVWDRKVVKAGPSIRVQGQYFSVGESEFWLSGTNYYESTRGEIMWFRPDVKRIARDLREMHRHGVNYLRPHYHHLKWFKDYLQFQHGEMPPYFAELEHIEDPLPSDRAWRNFDMMIYLCQKNGIIYGGDLFTLVPEEMGDPRGWFPLLEVIYCEDKRKIQTAFLTALSERYRDAPGISWDLWNEPEAPVEGLRDWARDHHRTINAVRPRLITVGGSSGTSLGDSVDYLALHDPPNLLANTVNRTSQPVIIQEIYFPHEEDLESELQQAEELRTAYFLAVKNGMCGFVPWCWTRQMRLWQDSYEHDPSFRMESWDDRLGTHVHDDGTIKPAGQVYRDLSTVLRTIRFESFDAASGKILTAAGEVLVSIGDSRESGYSLLHISGGSCFAGVARGSIAWRGRTLCSGPASGYVLAFADGSGDLSTTRRLMVKTEAPGELRIPLRSGSPASVKLVDLNPAKQLELASLEWQVNGNSIMIPIRRNMQAYWVRIEW